MGILCKSFLHKEGNSGLYRYRLQGEKPQEATKGGTLFKDYVLTIFYILTEG